MRKPKKSKTTKPSTAAHSRPVVEFAATERLPRKFDWVAQPKARKFLGDPSPVTWWRWRQKSGFPTAKIINGRLYFLWGELADWWESQPDRRQAA